MYIVLIIVIQITLTLLVVLPEAWVALLVAEVLAVLCPGSICLSL